MPDRDEPPSRCARCGATVAGDAPDGLCPRCLVALNFVTETDIPGEEGGPAGTHAVKAVAPSAPTPGEIAQHFPQFEILECLGRGGMGAVYKARQPKLDRCVALKILLRRHEDGSADTAFAERFAREARALARLNHPNIVAVYDYGEAGGYPFLVMEYVEGLTLRQLLQRGKMAPAEALAIVPKICEALQFAHQNGIVHRDIKPENILLDKSGQVKITDFGIAKIIAPGAPDHSLTGAKDVVGTPHYMAPEQVEQPQRVDHRADIYSLGVVFYEMLTGELPLGKFQPPSNKVQIDVRLDEVVLRALAKEPERRYQQASQVKTAVETITHSTPPSAPNLPPRLCPAALMGASLVWFLPFSLLLTTSLGWTAVMQIRRSAGRLYGLGLAVFDGLLFPLLALDALIVGLPIGVWLWLGFKPENMEAANLDRKLLFLLTIVVALAVAAAVDNYIVRCVWRAVKKPINHRSGTAADTGNSPAHNPQAVVGSGDTGALAKDKGQSPPHFSNSPSLIWKTLRRAALVALLQLGWLETILQGAVHWRESTGEVWFMFFFLISLVAVVWAVWPVRWIRFDLLMAPGVAVALFLGLCGLDFVYMTRVRPNLGLYEEDDWLSQWSGGRWGWRQMTANALWHKPPAGPFTAPVATILPLDEQHPVALLDLDTGRQQSRDSFAPDDEETLASVRAEKLDLAIVSGKNKITVLGLGLRAGYVPVRPDLVRVEELTSQAAVNYWALDRKLAAAVADLQVHQDMIGTYAFHTREGGIGFLEFAGLSDNPRGVKVSYKLVRGAAASPAISAAAHNLSFGPVIEREVNDGATNSLLDLDTGLFVTIQPATATLSLDEARKQEAVAYARAGADVAGLSPKVSEVSGLMGLDLVASPILADSWDTASVQWVEDAIASLSSGSITPISGKGRLPASYVFKTREGGMGLLQILSFTDSPPQPSGVKIRYKLVQSVKGLAPAPAKNLSAIARTTQAVVQQQVATKLSAMKSRLRLTEVQEQAMRALLEKKLGLTGELSTKMTEGGLSKEEMEKADRVMRDLDQQLKETLTPEQWTRYEALQVEERRTHAQLAANVEVMELQPVLQLSQTQRDQVLQRLTRLHEQQLVNTYEGLKIPVDWEQQLTDIGDALRPVLAAEQIQSLEKWLDMQRAAFKTMMSNGSQGTTTRTNLSK